ncbi:MAG TPA: lytic murein transglycosylase [Vicinamibacterales bacterium]|nr:lytic murein transglycosylase [Vicinamibacterales bacterium]
MRSSPSSAGGRQFGLALCLALLLSQRAATEPWRSGDQAVAPAPTPPADARPPFSEFLAQLKIQAVAAGVSQAMADRALDGLEPLEVVVERDRSQAEVVLTIDQYVTRRLTRAFVRTAVEKAKQHRATLADVEKKYGVDSSLIVAIWGMESNFGRFTGTRPTVQALATLAWEGRRRELFTRELIAALQVLDKGYIELEQMKGSWAGAMGQTQFMPSSYLEHAQDYDGDGRRDIWKTLPDVFASIANYLAAYGWKDDQTWGREVKVSPGGATKLAAAVGFRQSGCRASRELTVPVPLSKWQALGVRTVAGGALPRVDRSASLLRAGARSYLVYGNYDALLGYNCAHAYALAVGLLSDRLD